MSFLGQDGHGTQLDCLTASLGNWTLGDAVRLDADRRDNEGITTTMPGTTGAKMNQRGT